MAEQAAASSPAPAAGAPPVTPPAPTAGFDWKKWVGPVLGALLGGLGGNMLGGMFGGGGFGGMIFGLVGALAGGMVLGPKIVEWTGLGGEDNANRDSDARGRHRAGPAIGLTHAPVPAAVPLPNASPAPAATTASRIEMEQGIAAALLTRSAAPLQVADVSPQLPLAPVPHVIPTLTSGTSLA